MPKQQVTIEVDVPEGKLVEHKRCFAKGLCEASVFAGWHRFEVLLWLKDDWQWPDWLTAEWVAMDSDDAWYGYLNEPILCDGFWSGRRVLLTGFTDFQPPPCTDWRTSKRRRPT